MAVVHHETAERGGNSLDTWNCLVFRLEAGRIVELTGLGEDGAGEDEFWGKRRRPLDDGFRRAGGR